jgi:F0F1-type ATP synthase membrane subunit b/b'
MSKPIKEQLTDKFGAVKGEGKIRSENIREILSDAATQTVSELKEGTAQMRAILKDAISSAMTELKDSSSEIPDKITNSIENAIEESTRYRQEAIASLQAKIHDIQAQVDEKQRELDMDFQDTIIDIKATEIEENSHLNSAIDRAVDNVKHRQETSALKQQYLNLKFQLDNLDAKLAERYGDRYHEVKQQLEHVKTLYDRAKTEAEASGTTLVQSKQVEVEHKLSKFAATVAIAEREVKQYLQELWKNKDKAKAKAKDIDPNPTDIDR